MENSTTQVIPEPIHGISFQPVATATGTPEKGLKVTRRFTTEGVNPFDACQWETRTATISGPDGKAVFEQEGCEIPAHWSQMATNVVVSKYFRGAQGTPQRETSVRQVIGRVANTISEWGTFGGYFATPNDIYAFRAELTHLLLHQHGAFNSPVWFNIGVPNTSQQGSACFINSVQDTMESIMGLVQTEARLFKGGSGSGVNVSTIRSSKESLAGGGTASGPISFMRAHDAAAGAVKSGGATRRSAKMVILNADHPDIRDFITCKADEEKKAWALIDAGYDGGFNVPGGAYDSVAFQNANHSVRVTDFFMQAAEQGHYWRTNAVVTGEPVDHLDARDILMEIAEATHICGDPGMQFHTTINDWHTCPNSGPINSSNPCSEYKFLDNSACNLSSLNLLKFRHADGSFDAESFIHACEIFITAQEILVSNICYPTEQIARNSEDYRPLGLGYCNLGALLMAQGTAYDSDEGRALAAAITAIMTGAAYAQSARIAANLGAFNGYESNREPMLAVIQKHLDAAKKLPYEDPDLCVRAAHIWEAAFDLGEYYGYRNAQVTVLAPTGTISFLMDADTTGVEPAISLVSYKKLVGGGALKLVNQTVPEALTALDYDLEDIDLIQEYIGQNDTIEGAPRFLIDHLPVFDCAFAPASGTRSIHWQGHLKMMGAVQPFISGAISKTCNLPKDCTVQDIYDAYMEAWKLGIKAVAIYRDGSKRTQPLSTSKDKVAEEVPHILGGGRAEAERFAANHSEPTIFSPPQPYRRKLPDTCASVRHKFSIGGHEGYLQAGLYEDGTPGELFIKMSKEGSTISGLMDSFAIMVSMGLQYGVPVSVIVAKFKSTQFEPRGFTGNADIPSATIVMDYIARWLELRFGEPRFEIPSMELADQFAQALAEDGGYTPSTQSHSDAPPCATCGAIMQRAGACYCCPGCGSTSGCG